MTSILSFFLSLIAIFLMISTSYSQTVVSQASPLNGLPAPSSGRLLQSDVTGFWKLNREESDDPLVKMQELIASQATGAVSTAGNGQAPSLTQSLFHPDALVLASGPGDITINEAYKDFVQTRTMNTDGVTRKWALTQTANIAVTAARDDGRLVVETVSPRGNKLTETFRVAAGGRKLVETIVVADPSGKEIVSLRRSYDRAAADLMGGEEIL